MRLVRGGRRSWIGAGVALPRSAACWGQRTRRMSWAVALSERKSVGVALERGLRRLETLELVRECLEPGRLDGVVLVVAAVVKGSTPAADRLELELEVERSSAPSCASLAMAVLCRLAASSGGSCAACHLGMSSVGVDARM